MNTNAFDTFKAGAAQADAKLGQETRDYDRMLHGLGQVLDAAGLASGRADGWHWELHDRFHDPLCAVGAIQTCDELVRVVQSLDADLERRSHETSYLESQIAGGRLSPPFSPYYATTETHANLERQLSEIAQQFAEGGELLRQLDNASKLACHYRRCADIVAMLGRAVDIETGTGLAALRARTEALIASAAQYEAQARGVQARLRERQAAIPVEAAQSLKPLADLQPRTKPAFRNQAEAGRFASDARWMADLEALPEDARRLLAKGRADTDARLPQKNLAEIWDRSLKAPTPAALLGLLPGGRAVVVTEANQVATVEADRLRWLWQRLWPDSLALGGAQPQVLVLRRGGQPVAVLAIHSRLTADEFCVPVARQVAAAFPALTRPEPKRRRASLRAAPARANLETE